MKRLDSLFQVADITTSLAFYRDLLGFQVRYSLEGDDGQLIHAGITNGDVDLMLGVNQGEQDANPRPIARRGGVITYIGVDDEQDLDAFYNRVKAAGARVVSEPTDQFYGQREWTVIDPDGYEIVFWKHIPGFPANSQTAGESLVTSNS